MTKTEKAQLEGYKKSNKERKAKLLAKWGYKSHEAYFNAMGVPVSKGTAPKKSAPVKVKASKEVVKSTDYVIAFDCTGSMSGYIESVKTHVTTLINDLFDKSHDLKIKIVAFGDYCDAPGGTSTGNLGNAYQSIELTDDKKALINFVKNSRNTGGGDEDEFYELVIKKVNEETKWRDGNRAVLLIGDCKPHSPGYHYAGNTYQIDWKDGAKRAKELGIQYDTLKIHPNVKWYSELSEITGGVSMDFKNANKISNIIEGTIYARSSTRSFTASYAAATASGDSELIGAYKSMSTLLTDTDK